MPLLKQFALRLFHQGLVSAARRDDLKLAWELMHLDAVLGLGEYMPHPDFDPPRPWPVGPWAAQEQWQMSPELAFELIRASASGDPTPQPNRVSPFADRKLQLEAAVSLRGKLQTALKTLDQTIAGLER